MGGFNICLLPLFCATTKQNHQPLSIPAEIKPVTGPEVQPQLRNPRAHALCCREVATFHAQYSCQNPRPGANVELRDPIAIGNPTRWIDVFENFDHYLE